jgi:hypothetical protein
VFTGTAPDLEAPNVNQPRDSTPPSGDSPESVDHSTAPAKT